MTITHHYDVYLQVTMIWPLWRLLLSLPLKQRLISRKWHRTNKTWSWQPVFPCQKEMTMTKYNIVDSSIYSTRTIFGGGWNEVRKLIVSIHRLIPSVMCLVCMVGWKESSRKWNLSLGGLLLGWRVRWRERRERVSWWVGGVDMLYALSRLQWCYEWVSGLCYGCEVSEGL